ncbi:MAG: hypothetical protein AB1295_05745 [Candidatus Micrarchaeota archaeon]
MLLMTGVVLAIEAATFDYGSESRWSAGAASDSDVTEGGNITYGNVTATSLTDRWAAYFGNVSGTIRLWDGTNSVYTWTVTGGSEAGEVCASTGTTFAFGSSAATTGAEIDTAFGLGTAADTAVDTFTDATSVNLQFSQATVASSAYADHAAGTYWTAAIEDTGTPTESDLAFCTNVSSTGNPYLGGTAHYEVMVPTTPGVSSSETYYFYLELN